MPHRRRRTSQAAERMSAAILTRIAQIPTAAPRKPAMIEAIMDLVEDSGLDERHAST